MFGASLACFALKSKTACKSGGSASLPAIKETMQDDLVQNVEALDLRLRWLSAWMIHSANNLRESRDGIKVGGHQASCASMSTIMAALYGTALRPQDKVAVKPHAGPLLHAIHYLSGEQERDKMQRFRGIRLVLTSLGRPVICPTYTLSMDLMRSQSSVPGNCYAVEGEVLAEAMSITAPLFEGRLVSGSRILAVPPDEHAALRGADQKGWLEPSSLSIEPCNDGDCRDAAKCHRP